MKPDFLLRIEENGGGVFIPLSDAAGSYLEDYPRLLEEDGSLKVEKDFIEGYRELIEAEGLTID